jgi:hypothetical protein
MIYWKISKDKIYGVGNYVQVVKYYNDIKSWINADVAIPKMIISLWEIGREYD